MRSQSYPNCNISHAGEHYPFITRLLIDLFKSRELPNVHSINIEPEYGYCGRIQYVDGSVRLFKGSSLGINHLGASEVSKDKGYTKYFLQALGYQTPRGRVFLFPGFIKLIDRNLGRFGFHQYADIAKIHSFLDAEIGYPCFLKPNEGSQGRNVIRCVTPSEVQNAVEHLEASGLNKVIVEEAIPMPDFRVVVLQNEIISCYRRIPLSVIGDGVSSIQNLLSNKQLSFEQVGRDTIIDTHDNRIAAKLKLAGHAWETVLDANKEFPLHDASNLSLGGESEDLSDKIHEHWKLMCIRLAHEFGLAFCGIDIACSDITQPSGAYSILEINAAPGLDNYAASGTRQLNLVRNLYKRVFNNSMFLDRD